MDPAGPEVPLIDLLGGDACLWIVPVAVRSDGRCLRGASLETAALLNQEEAATSAAVALDADSSGSDATAK
jgi:hypothetical protein